MRETINLKGEEEQFPQQEEKRRPRRGKMIAWIIAAVLVIAFGWWFVDGATQWKAVFLTNNQVYFGHFWKIPFEGTITLRNVYYLQFSQPGQDISTQNQSQLKLVKLGSEIHGPTDEMEIPVQQILFWETLRADSSIVEAIKNAK